MKIPKIKIPEMKICKCIVTYFLSKDMKKKTMYYGGHSACKGLNENKSRTNKISKTELVCVTTRNPFKWLYNMTY